jgi:hypothetical protein
MSHYMSSLSFHARYVKHAVQQDACLGPITPNLMMPCVVGAFLYGRDRERLREQCMGFYSLCGLTDPTVHAI